MPSVNLIMDGTGCWPDLSEREVLRGVQLSIAAMPKGMVSGAPSVSFRFDLEDGRVVWGETSLALLLSAADAFKARYGDPRHWDGGVFIDS